MTEAQQTLAIYLHLARASELRRRWLVRDKLLLLCAMQAHDAELDSLAEHCRQRLLAHNSGHLAGRFADLRTASADEGLMMLVAQVERTFSREKVEYMLQSLGVELGHADATYATAEEYLHSILGPAPRIDGDAGKTDVDGENGVLTHLPSPVEGASPRALEPTMTVAELAAQERSELNGLLTGIAGLAVGILVWGAFLWRR